MPFLRDSNIGTTQYTLQDFEPTSGESFSATIDETLAGNPTNVLYNLGKVREQNTWGDKLNADDAASQIKSSGVTGITAKDGEYSRYALDTIIERKRQEKIRQEVLGQTNYSWGGTPSRGLAMLGAAIIDPLNIVSAFIPVVGEARVASILGNTASGSLARAGARAGIGATEGAVGAALIEPVNLIGRTQLQDDYSMGDSIANIAFGGVLGAGLHAGAGKLADSFRAVDPFEKFSGLSPEQVRSVFDFEKARSTGLADVELEKQTSGWTDGMRQAAGLEPTAKDVPISEQLYNEATAEVPPIKKDEWQALLDSYGEDVSRTVNNRDLPFNRIEDITPERANEVAAKQIADELKAQALADAGNRAGKGDIARLRQESESLARQVAKNTEEADALATQTEVSNLKELTRQYQGDGLKFKEAQKKAQKEIDRLNNQVKLGNEDIQAQRQAILARNEDIAARQQAIQDQIDNNARATQGEQNLAELERGNIPDVYRNQVEQRAKQLLAQADIQRAVRPEPARTMIDAATPEQRAAAFKSGLAQMLNGRDPDVEVLFKADPKLHEVQAVSDRTNSADSLSIGNKASSEAATQRLEEAPKNMDLVDAEEQLKKSTDRLNELTKNLELGGMDKERAKVYLDELAQFDDAIKQAESYAKAVKAAAICGLRS